MRLISLLNLFASFVMGGLAEVAFFLVVLKLLYGYIASSVLIAFFILMQYFLREKVGWAGLAVFAGSAILGFLLTFYLFLVCLLSANPL